MSSLLSGRGRVDNPQRQFDAPCRWGPDGCIEFDLTDGADSLAAARNDPLAVDRRYEARRIRRWANVDRLTRKRDATDVARERRDVPAVVRHPPIEVFTARIREVTRDSASHDQHADAQFFMRHPGACWSDDGSDLKHADVAAHVREVEFGPPRN